MAYLIPYNYAALFYAFFIFRDILVTVMFLYHMHTLYPLIWRKWIVLLIAFSLVLCNIIGILCALGMPIIIQDILGNYISIILKCFGFFLLFIQFIRWFIFVYKNKNSSTMNSRLYLCNLFAISIFTFICYDWSVYFSPSGIIPDEWGLTFGMNFFTMYNYIVAGTSITLTIVTLRLARLETAESRVYNII